jgi:DNA polymerase III alpha subunit
MTYIADKVALPQLRVRTEFSFQQAYGPVKRVAAALAELKCPAAGIVDGGTWGHVKWAKELNAVGVKPLFGTELVVPMADGRKPTAWALAEDTAAFYRFSTAARREDADIAQLFREARGVVRFAGAALSDPDCFDYVDLNPASPLQQRRALALAKETGKPLVITSDNSYPRPQDRAAFMALIDRSKVTPQHILSNEELREQLRCLDDQQYARAVAATFEVAHRCRNASELPKAPIIQVPGDLRALALEGKRRRIALGHISRWTQEYAKRLERELVAIEQKGFESYFIVVADMIAWAKERMLVGPGRGSSAGSLLCYCIGITEVDPLVHGLLFERFIDLTRKDLPDIDVDFNDEKRDLVIDYLAEKYGRDCVARIGNINTYKPKSVLAAVCKRFGIPDYERFNLVNVLIEYSSGDSRYGKGLEDTLNNTDVGRSFMERHPKAAVMGEVENHASHTGVHAAGVIVCNVPVSDYCTVGSDGVAHVDKPDAEALNLLKIDALGLRTLGIIEDAGVTTADELYALKLNDPEVFKVFNDRKYCALFQFEGQSQRSISAQVAVNDFQTIDHLTALSRPGPLGGGATGKYVERKRGDWGEEEEHEKYIAHMLEDTFGVVLYQEQVMRIVREIGKFSWDETTVIRKAMSGRKGKEYFDQQGEKFIAGAAQDGIPAHHAKAIWEQICSFGAWGMNKSHTCAYAIISYWCAWMKRYHPLQYAAACLRHAKDDDQTMEILREMAEEGVSYVAFDIERSDVNWAAVDGALLGGFMNLEGIGPAKARKAVEDRTAGKMSDEQRAKLLALPVKFSELYPLRAAYAGIYADPYAHGCAEGSVLLTADQFPAAGNVLYLGQLVKKERRDQNETVRVARRGGKLLRGPTLFADLVLKDDTGIPVICRIDRFDYEPLGRIAIENLVVGEDVLLVRGRRVPNFSMITIDRVKCLNRPEALREQKAGAAPVGQDAQQSAGQAEPAAD